MTPVEIEIRDGGRITTTLIHVASRDFTKIHRAVADIARKCRWPQYRVGIAGCWSRWNTNTTKQ